MSKMSFIMPVYEPDLILFEKVIKALVVQSLKDWELVAVLDGPCEDATRTIQRLMKKCPNHYKIIEVEHGGGAKTKKQGL